MAAPLDRSRRTLRWVLVGLLALGITWAAPSASATVANGAEQRPQLFQIAVPAGSHAVLVARPASGPAHHLQGRLADAACAAVASVPGSAPAVAASPSCESAASLAYAYSPGPRAPPFNGLV